MATTTPKYNLIKPTELSDFVDIDQLNANMDAVDTNLWKSARGFLATAIQSVNPLSPGDSVLVTSPAVSLSANRRIRIAFEGNGTCNAAGGTGHSFKVERSIDGGAWTQVGSTFFKVYGNTSPTIYDGYHYEVKDEPAAGSVQYRVRAIGHGINGNNASGCEIYVYDVGGY